jgi:hypothetical protein
VTSAKRLALGIVLVSMLGGCRLHLSQGRENNIVGNNRYQAIELGQDRRGDVMTSLGPPDRVFYAPSALIFDYLWKRHRGTDTRLFIPSEIIPGVDPLFFLSVPRFFFDPSEEPDEFRPNLVERFAEGLTRLATFMVPFANGQDLLILSGHQLRSDRLRIVFDRESLVVQGKSLRYASGEYTDESLRDRLLLRAD